MTAHRLRVRLREATSNAILEAAEAVAAREGSAAVSLQAVAEQAGISVGTIYNYFEDKEQLFNAVFAQRKRELFEAIDAAAKQYAKQSFDVQLDAFVRAMFVHFDGRRNFLRLALSGEAPAAPPAKGKAQLKQPALRQLQEHAERVMRIGVREKQLRAGDPQLLAAVLVAIIRAVLMLRADGTQPLVAETERVTGLFLDGARA